MTSEVMPPCTLWDSMDREVDDVLAEESSDNESQGAWNSNTRDKKENEEQWHHQGTGQSARRGPVSWAPGCEEVQTLESAEDRPMTGRVQRGHKRKHEEEEAKEGKRVDCSEDESSKDSNEEE